MPVMTEMYECLAETRRSTPLVLVVGKGVSRASVRQVLQNEGMRILEARTGIDAIKLARGKAPDVIVLNTKLPDMPGCTAAEILRNSSESCHVPILHLVPGDVNEQDSRLIRGADSYLVEPFDGSLLVASIQALLRIRRIEMTNLALANRWQVTFNAIRDAVLLIDNNGRILGANKAAAHLLSCEDADLVGAYAEEIMANGLHPCRPVLEGLQDGICPASREMKLNGRWYHISLNALTDGNAAFGLMCNFADITFEKDAEQERLHSRRKTEAILASITDSYFALDRKWRFTEINANAVAFFGVARQDLIGKVIWDEFPELVDSEIFTRCTSALESGAPAHFETRAELMPGWFEMHAYPSESGLEVYLRNITDRKNAEQHLHDTIKDLDSFCYSVSHDLRSPLRALSGFARLLVEEHRNELSSEALHYAETITSSAAQIAALVDDLLDFSRLGRKELAVAHVDVEQLLDSVIEEISQEDADRIVTITRGCTPPCEADPILLKQVYRNLLSNAFKYTRPRKHAVIEVGGYPSDAATVYYVKDNGVGFDMKYADRVFGAFQRLHRPDEFEGSGIGLAIVHRIVTRHNGRIWAQAEEDKGAAFYFTLGTRPGAQEG